MTKEQKLLAIQQREEGKSYGAIASDMKIPVSTVKSFFNRLKEEQIQPLAIKCQYAPRCRHCQTPLILNRKNQMRRFCSEACRQKWWKAHVGERTEKHPWSVCVACGVSFYNKGNAKRLYCSRNCYMNTRFHAEGVHEAR